MSKSSGTDLFERLTLWVARSLEKRPSICDVHLSHLPPAQRHQLVTWEQRNSCLLPDDLKHFYLTSDGLLLRWSVKLDENSMPVGRMEINSITDVKKLAGEKPSTTSNNGLEMIDYDSEEEDNVCDHPHFDQRSCVFELDPCDGHGKVCLVYKDTKPGTAAPRIPEVWFLDRALRWHFLAPTFTHYFRLMLMHLGLPQWQYVFTDIGLTPQAKQWFNMYAPERALVSGELGIDPDSHTTGPIPTIKLDAAKVFKNKTERKVKSGTQQSQKRRLASAAKPLSGHPGSRSAVSTSSAKLR
ncbi:tubulin polyglutamylase complex subunit 2-like [Amphiura filiformis]|uniref:tubulin polyglutamylase complex subunit 2-like n=1 Tax=Amphiura filiformis TaxID=82378 RepID=UPI003B22522E